MSAFAILDEDGTGLEPRVADAMHWGLVSCPAGASLISVAALMTDERVHCVVVIDDLSSMGSLWGVISDLDLIAAASVRGLAEQTAGGTAMTPAVTIAPDEQLERAAALMTRYGVAHLVVVDSRRAAARRSGVEPRPRRRPGHAVARLRYVGPQRYVLASDITTNERTKYPFPCLAAGIHRRHRTVLHRRRRQATRPECPYDDLADGRRPST